MPTKITYIAQSIIYAFQLLTSEKLNSALPKNSPVLEIRKKEVGADRAGEARPGQAATKIINIRL